MQVIKCFEVMGHTDTTEGRGQMKVVARFSDKGEATKFIKSKVYSKWCVMGYQSNTDLNNIREATITIMDTIEEYQQSETEMLKAKTMAKLSVEERQALGL